MDSEVQIADPKEAFRRKAAWFSFLAPLSCILIFFAFLLVQDRFSEGVQDLAFKLIGGGTFFIQIISVVMGGYGIFAKDIIAKIFAVLGIVISLVVGFFAFFVLAFSIWGWNGC
jgi:hypothetical protein